MRVKVNEVIEWNLYLDLCAVDPNPALKGRIVKAKYGLCILSARELHKLLGVSSFYFLYSTSAEYLRDFSYCVEVQTVSFSDYSSDSSVAMHIRSFQKKTCHFDTRRPYKACFSEIQSKADRGKFLYFAKLIDEVVALEIQAKLRKCEILKGYSAYEKMGTIECEKVKDSIKKTFGI